MHARLESRYPESGSALLLDYVEGTPNCEFHYQPELELVLVRGCMGRRMIGDDVSDFKEYDLVLVGPYVPHMWQTMAVDADASQADAIVIHFSRESLGLELLSKPELRPVRELLDRASRALSFGDDAREKVESLLDQLVEGDELVRLTRLLEALNQLATVSSTPIATHDYDEDAVSRDQKLYGSVLEYVHHNHHQPIALAEVAKHACMSVSGFCRFFKRVNGESFVTFLNQWRIDRSCMLLEQTNMSVSHICFGVGYGNLSHFNRQFRRYKGLSPRRYRQRCEEDSTRTGGNV